MRSHLWEYGSLLLQACKGAPPIPFLTWKFGETLQRVTAFSANLWSFDTILPFLELPKPEALFIFP